jgi:hypothetical protein
VDLPIENGGSFHSYVNVYQRVDATLMQKKNAWTTGSTATPPRISGSAKMLSFSGLSLRMDSMKIKMGSSIMSKMWIYNSILYILYYYGTKQTQTITMIKTEWNQF